MNPGLAPANVDTERGEVTTNEAIWALIRCLPFAIVIFSVMGFIMLGIATPSESAATGVLGALLTAAIYRNLSLRMIWDSLMASITVAAMILVIMAMSKMFTQLLAFTGATGQLVTLVAQSRLWAHADVDHHDGRAFSALHVHRHDRRHSPDHSDLSAGGRQPRLRSRLVLAFCS